MSNELITCNAVTKRFPLPEGKGEFTAVGGVTLSIRRGEVLALLGRSGSGKSTLLRMMAGLISPSEGTISSNGTVLRGPNQDVSMVFQSFALLPWLTVLDNVELGLEARGVNRASRARRALRVLDLVGLDGFESAYPKELSGGMKQRVGYARALAVEPKVLFMDEPFSALDVLTAENLRGEIDDLWNAGNFPSQSILLVTHNIEEAVILADRVIVLGSNPGHIRGEVQIDLPRPHDRNSQHFRDLVDHLYEVMTNPEADVARAVAAAAATVAKPSSPFGGALPHVRIGSVSGLLELLSEDEKQTQDLSEVAEGLAITVDDLLALLEAAAMLDFAKIFEGEVSLTERGRDFATTTILRSKEVFREQLLSRLPIFTTIVRTLSASRSKTMPADFFLDLWEEHFPEEEAQRQLATAVEWGRYAELFEYDTLERVLRLHEEAPEEESATA